MWHEPDWHVWPFGQPQSWQQLACVSPVSHRPLPQTVAAWHAPAAHVSPEGQPQSAQQVPCVSEPSHRPSPHVTRAHAPERHSSPAGQPQSRQHEACVSPGLHAPSPHEATGPVEHRCTETSQRLPTGQFVSSPQARSATV
jgi:hypothetical protein